jgi:hypothetical protein
MDFNPQPLSVEPCSLTTGYCIKFQHNTKDILKQPHKNSKNYPNLTITLSTRPEVQGKKFELYNESGKTLTLNKTPDCTYQPPFILRGLLKQFK